MHHTAFVSTKATSDSARLKRRLLTAFFLSTATVSAPIFTPAFAQEYSFNQVVIEGNNLVDAPTILGFAGIKRGQVLSVAQLNDAYQGIVRSGLFEEVEITPQGNQLVIRVKEFPVVNIINFEGNKRLKDEELAEIVTSKARRVYSPSTAEADAATIAEVYRARGRMAATVTPKIIRRSESRVDLVFEITEGRVTEIERLSFIGNRAFTDRRLRQVLETKQAGLLRTLIQRDTLVPERLELDKQLLRDFYLARGYVDVQITDASSEVARERDAAFVSFSISEGRSFKIGKISTVSEIPDVDTAEFEQAQRIRSGVTYSPAVIENNIARMENLALRKGLNFVRVDPRITRNDRDGTLDIEFAIVRGQRIFVERIDIEGNTTTLDRVVRREFRSAEGDPFNPREIRQSAERIRALGFFADAQVEAKQGSGSDQVIVDVNVEEQPTGSLSFGATYGLEAGIGLNVGFSETNFLGRGQAFSLNISTGTDNSNSSISFTEPAFLGRDLALSFGAFYNQTNQQNALYDTGYVGLRTSLAFPVGELSRLELRYGLAENTIKDYIGRDVTVPPDGINEFNPILVNEAAREGEVVSAIGYTYSYDTRIGGLSTDRAVLLRFSQDFAGLGGDAKYISTNVLALAERKIMNEEITLRAIFEGGAVMTRGGYVSRVTDRFFGNGKIRGFEPNGIGPRDLVTDDALGGNYYATARLEADFPLGFPEEYGISGGMFLDVGSVWGLDDTIGGTIDDSAHPRASIGVSLLWDAPIGPLRFNFSKALKKESYDKEQSFDLTISTKF